VALAAIYRQTFAPDLDEAREAQRSAVHLLCIGIPADEVEAWKKLLARDFSVTNGEEARATVEEMVDSLTSQASDADRALWVGRAAHLATGAAAVGYTDAVEALDCLEPAVELAVGCFDSWDNYAQSFLAGERNAPGSNVIGRKVLASVAKKLLEDELSP
jgi:chromosome condensin MukBEF ATPase and DNA-binding subunit MukB